MTKIRSYADMMAELQQVLAELQSDGLDVDAALDRYAQGQALVKELQAYLKTAENKIVDSEPTVSRVKT